MLLCGSSFYLTVSAKTLHSKFQVQVLTDNIELTCKHTLFHSGSHVFMLDNAELDACFPGFHLEHTLAWSTFSYQVYKTMAHQRQGKPRTTVLHTYSGQSVSSDACSFSVPSQSNKKVTYQRQGQARTSFLNISSRKRQIYRQDIFWCKFLHTCFRKGTHCKH